MGVLSYPPSFVLGSAPLPKQVVRTTLEDLSEENLQAKLTEIAHNQGQVGTLIHLAPILLDEKKNENVFSAKSESVVRHLFLLAKHLKATLNQASRLGRPAFLTSIRLDGALGLGKSTDFDPVMGGFLGLVKTLRLEWPNVYCRAVDIASELTVGETVQHLLAELDDPDRLLTEVCYGPLGRQTLVTVPIAQD